jgi:hypothetical protein
MMVSSDEQPGASTSDEQSASLPRRDWLIIPLLIVLTIVVLVSALESVARHAFTESKTTTLACLVLDDLHTPVHAKPNSVCSQKIFESGLTEFRFNECGYRTGLACSAPPANTFRIVLLGSSLAEGMWVPVEQTFATRLPEEISQITGRKVDLYNEAMQWGTPRSVDLRIGDVMKIKPDLAFWPITPWDIENVNLRLPYIPGKQEEDNGDVTINNAIQHQPAPQGLWQKFIAAYRKNGSISAVLEAKWRRIVQPLSETRTVFLIKHELYKSQNQFLKHFVMDGESAGFLNKETPADWKQHLDDFDRYMEDVSGQLKAANIPLVVTLLPHRSQTDMVSMGEWPANQDPYRLGDQIRKIAEKHGAIYFDSLQDYRDISSPDRYFFPVDGHMNAGGHRVLSDILAKKLTSGIVPELQSKQTSTTKPSGTR